MIEPVAPSPIPRAAEANVPGITDDILRAVEALEDQLEQVLGPRPAPPRPILRNVNAVVAAQMTTGDHVADAVAAPMAPGALSPSHRRCCLFGSS